MKLKLIVSDFHMGKGRYLPDKTQNILEDFVYDSEFADFLDHYRSGPFADAEVELVLNGDILNLLQMDSWGVHTHLITERAVIRAIDRIVSGHPEVFEALRRFANAPKHTISYVIGNHDSGLLWPGARKAFCGKLGVEVRFFEVAYEFDGIYVEHGQQHEKFARTDMGKPFITRRLPEPVLNLPWGSLFTAILLPRIKQSRSHVDKVRPLPLFLRWAAIHDLWWGIKTVGLITKFIVDTTLFRRRYQIQEGVRNTLGILKEISVYPSFDKIAFRILQDREDIHTVVFGHTHIIRYRQWREGKEYFNIGTWNETTNLSLEDYGKHVRLTYAIVEYPEQTETAIAQRPKVRLKRWNGVWRPEADVLA